MTDSLQGGETAALESLRLELREERAAREALATDLESAIVHLETSEGEIEQLVAAVQQAAVRTRALSRRVRSLERKLETAARRAASAHEQLRAERLWVAAHTRSVAASSSWRLGHRLVRVTRALVFRGDKGADGLTVILRRMDDRSGG